MAKKKSEKAPRYFENEILNVDREMLCKLHGWNLKLYIVLLNHFNGLTPDDLCAYLEAARRTVYRAIAFMKKKGLIIEKEGGFLCLNLCQNLKEEADKTDKEKRTKKEKEKINQEKNYATALEGVRARPADFYLDCLCDDDDTLRALCKINRLTVENPDDHNKLCQVLHTYMTDFIDMLIAQGKKNSTTK